MITVGSNHKLHEIQSRCDGIRLKKLDAYQYIHGNINILRIFNV